ncbi:ABC transporter permease [Actinomadura rugatobispora]|uniref:ABC transporter permease n=1 Tax=Actinomadura rugatobispora TaxID=1994 RepID=A0ABW1A8T1_9ACTN|nr:ABC transporter permease [Actinomadura rugatobispora]
MLRLIISRLAALAPLLLIVSLATFLLSALLPEEPAAIVAGDNTDPANLARISARLGTDRPLIVRYGDWLAGAVTGDLGTSYFSSVPVGPQLAERAGTTLSIAAGGLVLATLFGTTAGILAAVLRGGAVDRAVTLLTSTAMAAPPFWVGLLLVSFFAIRLGWFPPAGYVPPAGGLGAWLGSIALPSVALALAPGAYLARQTRGSMVGVLEREYVRTAIARGYRPGRVILRHAVRNGLSPVVTLLGFQVTILIGGSLVVEKVFALPGLGSLAIEAVLRQDIPVVQGLVVTIATAVVLVNLLLDLVYGYLNPKVRLS